MPTKTTANRRTASSDDRLSLTALIVVLVVTNVWFISQALGYV